MDTIPHPRTASPRLTADEREVVVTYNDADRTWRVYSDSATMRGAVLRLARQLGAGLRRVGGQGLEFEAPGDAMRLTARRRLRLTEGQREARRARAFRRTHSMRSGEGKMAVLGGPGGAQRDGSPQPENSETPVAKGE